MWACSLHILILIEKWIIMLILDILCVKKSELVAGLIDPSIDIGILVLKLHVGNEWNEGILSNKIAIHEELSENYSGLNKSKRIRLIDYVCCKKW